MFFLDVLNSETLHIVAEMLAIVIGSILMGILFAYLHWGRYKRRVSQLNNKLDFERNQIAELNSQLNQVSDIRNNLASEISDERSKQNVQAKKIYEQQQQLYSNELQLKEKQSTIEQLTALLDSFQNRLKVIEEEIHQSVIPAPVQMKSHFIPATRASYDHVSMLLGRQVTENDLTVISGIGLRTSSLLQAVGIDTWDRLAQARVEDLQRILSEAGGIYKSQDPTHWPKQAAMASQSEWRKLRVFQETLKNIE